MQKDLFGQIPVSLREIELWLYLVPRIPHYSSKRESYARQWNVAHKIAREKAADRLEAMLGDCLCEFCGQILCQEESDAPAPIAPAAELSRLKRRVAVLEMVLAASLLPQREKPAGVPAFAP